MIQRLKHNGDNTVMPYQSANKILVDSKTILIYDDIDRYLASDISESISGFNNEDVLVKINSEGGGLYESIAVMTEFIQYKGHIEIDITGVAFSGAALIALCGDKLRMSEFGSLMFHYPRWPTEDITLSEHERELVALKEHYLRVCKIIMAGTNIRYKDLKDKLKDDWYITPKEALKLKVIDEIYKH